MVRYFVTLDLRADDFFADVAIGTSAVAEIVPAQVARKHETTTGIREPVSAPNAARESPGTPGGGGTPDPPLEVEPDEGEVVDVEVDELVGVVGGLVTTAPGVVVVVVDGDVVVVVGATVICDGTAVEVDASSSS
jgi:hypothetical protein